MAGQRHQFTAKLSNRTIASLLLAICWSILYVLILCVGSYYGADLLHHLTILGMSS
jgi:hypothetical protein